MTRGLETITVSFILPFINCFQPFSDCKINVEGMKIISSFLSQDGVALEELDLGLKEKNQHEIFTYKTGNNKFGDECCAYLAEGLKKNKSMKILNLEGISSTLPCYNFFQSVRSMLKE